MISTIYYNSMFEQKLKSLDLKIKENQFVIGGSFVISTILDKNYQYSDINIYVNYSIKFRENGSIDSEFDNWIVNNMGGVLLLISHNNLENQSSYKYICPTITLNIISTNFKSKNEIKEYIKQTSDLDICTSTYDGYISEFPETLLTMKANVINQHLINRYDSLTEKTIYLKQFNKARRNRHYKYILRGFEINNHENIVILTDFDKTNTKKFYNKLHKEENVIRYACLWIAEKIKTLNSNIYTLNKILNEISLFKYLSDYPYFDQTLPLTYKNFSWAKVWNKIT